VTVRANTPLQDALKLMRDHQFRRLPVVNEKGKLVGIVSEVDLLHAAPSSATSLSIWEVQYLLAKIRIKEIMTKEVVITAPDAPLEDTARFMVTRKIGGCLLSMNTMVSLASSPRQTSLRPLSRCLRAAKLGYA
jgi:acetoin utilization protein AcuB